MIDIEQLKLEANGKWPGIMDRLGIGVGTGKHCPCPACGGDDRFRFDDKDGTGSYYCNQCGAGDGISLVQKVLGLDFKDTVVRIEGIIGSVTVAPLKKKNDFDVKRLLNGIWQASKPLCGSDFVSRYLHSRGLIITPENIRSCEFCYESDSKTKLNAMVGLVSCVDGSAGAIHRTYLTGTEKADIKSPKKLTPNTKPLSGGAVRLFPLKYKTLTGDTLGITEGIETAIAACQLFDIPTWAAIGTSMLESFVPPDGVRKLVVFGDNDANFAGQKAAYTLANKWVLKDMVVNVEIPESVGDFNDIITAASTA